MLILLILDTAAAQVSQKWCWTGLLSMCECPTPPNGLTYKFQNGGQGTPLLWTTQERNSVKRGTRAWGGGTAANGSKLPGPEFDFEYRPSGIAPWESFGARENGVNEMDWIASGPIAAAALYYSAPPAGSNKCVFDEFDVRFARVPSTVGAQWTHKVPSEGTTALDISLPMTTAHEISHMMALRHDVDNYGTSFPSLTQASYSFGPTSSPFSLLVPDQGRRAIA